MEVLKQPSVTKAENNVFLVQVSEAGHEKRSTRGVGRIFTIRFPPAARDADSQIRWMRWMRWDGVWEELRMNRRRRASGPRPCIPSLATAAGWVTSQRSGRWIDGWVWHVRQFSPRRSLASECGGGGAKVRPPASPRLLRLSPRPPPIRAVTDIRLARLRNLAPPPLPLTDLQQGCPLAT